MKSYSSTTLNVFTANCPKALGYMENHEPQYREIFQTGIAAHAVLQAAGEKNATTEPEIRAVAVAVTEELITRGRAFKGHPEPPMQPESAFEGRDLAVAWLLDNPLPDPDASSYECLYGMDQNGEAVIAGVYRYDAIIDCVYSETAGDEDWEGKTVVVRDYKTSWQADKSELDTLQRKGQAVLAWIHHPDVAGITREVINLRTWAVYRETTWLDDEGIATLKGWRDDILTLCKAADATREARPGVGCIGCAYVLRCDDCMALLGTRERPAAAWAVAQAVVKFTGPLVKKQAAHNPIPDGVGGLIGFMPKTKRQLTDDCFDQVKALGLDQGALLQALKPGVGNIDKLAKAVFDKSRMPERLDFLDLCLESFADKEFCGWIEK